jgi:hypothetical protein
VRRRSSTPLLAKSRHIPERIPENDAYENARIVRVRAMLLFFVMAAVEELDNELSDDGVLCAAERSGVRSVVGNSSPTFSTNPVVRTEGSVRECDRGAKETLEPVSGEDERVAIRLERVNSVMCVVTRHTIMTNERREK